jgi:hypothetical protein
MIYVVSGRCHGDDEDTLMQVEADSKDAAEQMLLRELLQCDDTSTRLMFEEEVTYHNGTFGPYGPAFTKDELEVEWESCIEQGCRRSAIHIREVMNGNELADDWLVESIVEERKFSATQTPQSS